MKNKNIFVLPTTEPSQIYLIINENALGWTSKNPESMEHYGSGTHNQHVYITNKEPYVKGDWVKNVTIDLEVPFKLDDEGIIYTNLAPCNFDKIVLTTDLKLIADGVKEIDNEFLWSLCKKQFDFDNVEVEKTPLLSNNGRALYGYYYKPIIPKQKYKYPIGGYASGNYMCNCSTCKKQFMGDKRAVQCEPCAIEMVEKEYCTCTDECLGYLAMNCKGIEEPKQDKIMERFITNAKQQETLEEVKDLVYYKSNAEEDYLTVPISVLRYISELEKQQEISYSKENLDHLFSYIDSKSYHLNDDSMFIVKVSDIKKAFEKFKKK